MLPLRTVLGVLSGSVYLITVQFFNLLIVESRRTSPQIVLKREIVDSLWKTDNEEWKERIKAHRDKYPKDPLPIPFNDPEPQVMIPYHSDFPWHVQVHRDSFAYGDIRYRADPRVVVDLRFFGKSDISKDNKVTFPPLFVPHGEWEPVQKTSMECHRLRLVHFL